ncbi:MAG: hypothetical protein MO852_01745, partial [Candidatus Devosia euplotis]|nr:hypothetical protein [Candidatus Devosia euplotis]
MAADANQLRAIEPQFNKAALISAMISSAFATDAKPMPATNLSVGGSKRRESGRHNRLSTQEAGSLKAVAAPELVSDLGRPHRTLFQFLQGNSAHGLTLGGQKRLVNKWLDLAPGQMEMLLKIICKFNDLLRPVEAAMGFRQTDRGCTVTTTAKRTLTIAAASLLIGLIVLGL